MLFGVARDIVGDKVLDLTLPDHENVEGLMDKIKEQYPRFGDLKSLLIAVNDEYATKEKVLTSNDEIALIPPVSGG